MAKDPAVLFYYQDFLVGTDFMTNEEVGIYIRILCHQADKGRLNKKHMLKICNNQKIPDVILEKLKIDEDGNYYNERMELEKEKRRKYTESRRKNRKGEKHMNNISKTYVKHMENENENENRNENETDILDNKIPPKLKDVETFFVENQHSKEEAQKFFYHYEAQDWWTGGTNPQPITKWRPAAKKWMLNSKNYIKHNSENVMEIKFG